MYRFVNKRSGAEFYTSDADYQMMIDKGYGNKFYITQIEKKTRESMISKLPAEIIAKRKTVEAVETELAEVKHEPESAKAKRGRPSKQPQA